MRFVYNGDLRYISLLGYFYVSESTVYKLQQRIICTFADQWRIQVWAVGAAPPIDQKLGLFMAARLRQEGKFSLKSLIFGQFFLHKNVKKLSASGGGLQPP